MTVDSKYQFDSGVLVKSEKEYFLPKMKYFYSLYQNNMTSFNYAAGNSSAIPGRSIESLRRHARGMQDVDKYRMLVDPMYAASVRGKKTKQIKPINISWQPIPILSKFRNIFVNRLLSLLIEPHTQAVDNDADYDKNMMKNYMKLLRNHETSVMREGVVIDEPPEMAVVDSEEDVDTLFQMGGIKLAIEILMKDSIDATLKDSAWPILAKMVCEDLCDVCAFAIDEPVVNKKIKLTYVDPAKVVVSPSIYPDHRDSEYRGYLSFIKLSEIRTLVNDPKKFAEIKKKAKPYHQAGIVAPVGREQFSRSNSTFDFSSEAFGVQVMKMYFLDTQTEFYVSGTRKDGSKQFERVNPDTFNLSERAQKSGKELVSRDILYLYQCYWVVDTDIVFSGQDSGSYVVEGIARDINNRIVWPMTVYNGHEQSIIEKCIAFDDDLQLANYKLRLLISKLTPGPRMLIYQNLIKDSVKIGDDTYTIFDMIGTYQNEGIMVLDQAQEYSMPGEDNPTGQRPIEFLPSGIQEDLTSLRLRIYDQIDLIRQTTGFNEVSDGTTQQKDMLQSVMRGLDQATGNAIGPYVLMYVQGYKDIISHIGYRYQSLVLSGAIDVGHLIFGSLIRRVVLDRSIARYKFDIQVTVMSLEARQLLIDYLMSLREGIGVDAFFVVYNAIEQNDIKRAQYLLSKYVAKSTQENHERQMEIAQSTSRGNAEAAVATEEAKSRTLQASVGAEIEKQKNEHELRKELEQLLHSLRMKELEFQNKLTGQREVAVVEANNRNRLEQ